MVSYMWYAHRMLVISLGQGKEQHLPPLYRLWVHPEVLIILVLHSSTFTNICEKSPEEK